MKLSTEKSKVIVNSTGNTSSNVTIDEMSSFKKLGESISKNDTCNAAIRARITSGTVAMGKVVRVC